MKITAKALRYHPIMNSQWTSDGILLFPEVHMGMAMALDEGLVVPVIWDINRKSIGEVAEDRVALIRKGKEKKLTPDDLKGSSFTLSAMGMFDLESFTAIINQPENAILGVGTIIDKAVVREGQVIIRPMVNISLTYDHRAIDGAEAGKFMRTLKRMLESPEFIVA
jgi:pyruvate dehydrogenase E2 component (dihydrolipoamide acetyltransferase)